MGCRGWEIRTSYGCDGILFDNFLSALSKYRDGGIQLPRGPLYRYLSVSGERLGWLLDAIRNGNFYFPNSRQFNDPLDCKIEPTFEGMSYELEKWAEKTAKLESNRKLRLLKSEIVSGMIRTLANDTSKSGLIDEIYRTTDECGILSFSMMLPQLARERSERHEIHSLVGRLRGIGRRDCF